MKGDNAVFFDCETGGLDCNLNPITQIAMICVNFDTLEIIHKFDTFIKPYNNLALNPESIEKTMVTLNDLQQAPDSKQVLSDIIKFAKLSKGDAKGEQNRPILIGHNVGFDIAFLTKLFEFHNKNIFDYFSANNGVINNMDTMSLFRNQFRKINKITLTNCLEIAKLTITDAHGAMNDTLATLNLFRWLRSQSGSAGAAIIEEKAEKFRNTFQI